MRTLKDDIWGDCNMTGRMLGALLSIKEIVICEHSKFEQKAGGGLEKFNHKNIYNKKNLPLTK